MLTSKMNLKDKISAHIPVQDAANNADVFGVEVELEGRDISDPPENVYRYWSCLNDNSLRKLNPGDEALEYIFRFPYDYKTTQKAVNNLFHWLNHAPCQVFESYRTSIHVHVNFAQEEMRTVYNFMTLSLILDELLVSQNGEHRIGNNFCLRAKDAMGQSISLIKSIQSGNSIFGIQTNERYSSINFASCTKFGSIEFRSLECTTHEGRLMHWIGTLQAMKEAARKFKNPTEIVQKFSMMGPKAFVTMILGPFAIKYTNVRGFDQMLFEGMRIAQDLAYCSEWNEVTYNKMDTVKEDRHGSMTKYIAAKKAAGQW